MTPKRLPNLKSNVPRANPDMLAVAHPKIDVPRIRIIRQQNSEMIAWNKTAGQVAGRDPDET